MPKKITQDLLELTVTEKGYRRALFATVKAGGGGGSSSVASSCCCSN
jgi:hypothetical protein